MQKRFVIPIVAILCVAGVFFARWDSRRAGATSELASYVTAAEKVKSLQVRAKGNNSRLAAAKALTPRAHNPATPIYGTRWGRESEPELKQFSAWAGQFASATPAQKSQLMHAGIELAKERRLAMADLIERDPAAALSAAIPQDVRAELPEEVLAHAERRISGVGNLDVYGITPARGAKQSVPLIERTARLGGRTYQANTYGVLASFGTVKDLYMHGVAVDGRIALADAPVRTLEAGEKVVAGAAIIASHPVQLDPTLAQSAGAPRLAEGAGGYHCLCCSTEAKANYDGSRWAALGEGGTVAAAIGRAYQNTGSKSILVIPVQFPDQAGSPWSSDAVRDTGVSQIQSYFSTASYGAFNLNNATVISLQTLPSNRSTYRTGAGEYSSAILTTLATDASTLATAAGYNPANYDFVSFVINHNLWSGIAGVAYLGDKYSFIDGDGAETSAVYIHELGHNLGLWHAGSWDPTSNVPDSSSGTTSEYGNRFDAMGDTWTYSYDQLHFNASFKNALDWLPDSYVTTATTDVTMDLYAMDRTQVNGRKYAIKLTAGITLDGVSNLDYWVEFRSRYTGVDTIQNGVLIYTANTTHDEDASKLLDMAPTTSTFLDAGLPVGSPFTTADGLWRITVNSQAGSGNDSLINVTITDVRPPTITTHPASVSINTGASTTLTVVATGINLTYQWSKNGTDISGATASSLAISNATSADARSYVVVVSNAYGSATSNAATVTVTESSSSGGGGGGGCGYTTPPEQIILIGWAVLLLCRFLQFSRPRAGLPSIGGLTPREDAA